MDKNKKEIEKINLEQPTKKEPLIHDFSSGNLKSSFTPKIIGLLAVIIIFGVLSGFLFAGNKISSGGATNSLGSVINLNSAPKGTVVGSNDTKTFKDSAEGVVKEGGINGEGAFHLVRPGGDSQNVYLTSSIVDLSKFVNKKIKVWGQTQKAQSAGWLMDVGKIEVL
jgi:hypothetical protein